MDETTLAISNVRERPLVARGNDEVLQRGLQQHMETIKQKAAEADAQIQAEWLAASAPTPQQKFTQVCEPNQSCAV